ncbi:hypothetical protein [Dactylosporangium sp. CA-092794]|uniref:hypothetical protein n=1 Tax=Dactylosporangium sp. CA-092794 TaxID=3239929 RepID=UPI003D905C00
MGLVVDGDWDVDDVLVKIGHPWGDFEKPLVKWMASGPGPRHGIHPELARSRSTGEVLPLTVIPPAYRNDRESRALIAAGKIVSPWRDLPWLVDDWGERSCEIGGPRDFDRSVPDPERVDRLAARVLGVVPPSGPVEAETAARVLAQVPEFAAAAPIMVRRPAAEGRWAEFDAVIRLAGAAGLADVGSVLCELLESDVVMPRPGNVVDVLGELRLDAAADLLDSQVAQFVYAYGDAATARRCLRAMAVMGTNSRVRLTLLHWSEGWPVPVPEWAGEEVEATGERIPPPGGETYRRDATDGRD